MPRKTAPVVVLRPPFELMQPRPATVLPAEDVMAGSVQYSLKVDG